MLDLGGLLLERMSPVGVVYGFLLVPVRSFFPKAMKQ
jgi:hypothetical protein